jgi:hypothetical protein
LENFNSICLFVYKLKSLLKKLTSISLLVLLIFNILDSTFVFLIDKWQEQYIVQPNVFFEERGDQLVMKLPMSIPYLGSWEESEKTDGFIIYKGVFFRTTQRIFANDTLYTYGAKERAGQENMLSLLQQIKKHVSNAPVSPGRKALDFLKNLTKDYIQFDSSSVSFFEIEDLPLKIYTHHGIMLTSIKLVLSPPPDLV